MREQFVTYEIALKLKELGFDEECLARYPAVTVNYAIINELNPNNCLLIGNGGVNDLKAPLCQQVIDWLREKHDIIISINYWGKRNVTEINKTLYPNLYSYSICQELVPKEKWIEGWIDNYKEAREQAILKAIELIK